MRRTAALIVGGGPAGAAAAIMLARAGHAPDLVERSAGPRNIVCGGFLGWDALAALGRLGIDAPALGARPIHRLRLVCGDRQVEAALPFPAAGLSRRRLDEALLDAAAQAGTRLIRGRTARAIDPQSRSVRLDNGDEIAADTLLLATGKHDLRGSIRAVNRPPETLAVGLRAALPPCPIADGGLHDHVELHVFDGGYAGLLVQEDGSVNLCLSVSRRRLGEAGGVEALVDGLCNECPSLHQRLDGRRPQAWDAIAGVPYGWRARHTEAGLFRIGDQAAVIASLAGDGVAMALAGGIAAAEALLAGDPATSFQRDFARRAALPVLSAELLRIAAERGTLRPWLSAASRLPGLPGLCARLTRIR